MPKFAQKPDAVKDPTRVISVARKAHTLEAYESALEGTYLLTVAEHPNSFEIRRSVHLRSYTVGRSFSCIRRPGTALKIRSKKANTSSICVRFAQEWLEERFDEAGFCFSSLGDSFELIDTVLMSIVERLQEASCDDISTVEYEALCDALVRHLIDRHDVQRNPVATLKPPRLRTLLAYVDANLSRALSLDDMAAIAGATRFAFARSFAQQMGLPPHRYVMLRRTEAAMTMIRSGSMQLCEIASAAGFCDQAHMSRWISREISLTPNKLRTAPIPEARV